jgi:hypothetical protein
MAGNPARRIGWVCACGTRLPDPATAQGGAAAPVACPLCGRIYDFNPSSGSLVERPA